jgi:type II secretory pathway component PulK
MPYRPQRPVPYRRRGVVLLSVLIVVVLLSLAAYQYSELMMAEYRASDSFTRQIQARALADSGIHYAAALLSNPDTFTNTLNSNPYDNPNVFQSLAVNGTFPRGQGRFNILALQAPDDPSFQGQPTRFGVTDEAGKINLNALLMIDSTGTVGHDMLMKLPNMTEDVANSILDWLDSSTTTARTNGAKDDYYGSLDPPYRCKNGPLDTLDELLLVKGVTPQLLYGNDRNRNGVLDPDEDDGSGQVDLGWSAYLTVYSREPNVDSQGNARIYLNNQDLNTLQQQLSSAVGDDLAQFIISYRMYGPSGGGSDGGGASGAGAGGAMGSGGAGMGGGAGGGRTAPTAPMAPTAPKAAGSTRLTGDDLTAVRSQVQTDRAGASTNRRLTPISSLFDLINATVSVPVGSGTTQRNVTYTSPLADPTNQRQLLPLLLDATTTSKASDLPPRINVNTAPQTVLAALPNMTDSDVQAILGSRPPLTSTDPPDQIFSTPAWLLTEANLQPTTLKAIERYATSRTQVYRVQSLGYFDGGGPTSRVEAVIDTNNGRPRIIYYRPLDELGKGFSLGN